jgi:NAD(P)-dependent dehydrogenase (short-subunit alcohol dehydrogenase family)
VAVITGGGGGLAAAFADALTEQGARVALLDVDEAAAARAADALTARGVDALGLACNVRDEHRVDAAMQEVAAHFGRIDILVNNAALHRKEYNQPFGSLARDDLRALFDVNVMGIIHCSLACQPHMAAGGGGVVINIASTSANAARTPYGVSKLTVLGLTTALAGELGPDGIRVNAISPGFVGSAGPLQDYPRDRLLALLAALGSSLPAQVLERCTNEDLVAAIHDLHLVAREGTPHDVVEALLYLCSDAAGFVTGETLRIAGGSSISF